jgi:ribosomal protein L44E
LRKPAAEVKIIVQQCSEKATGESLINYRCSVCLAARRNAGFRKGHGK